MSIPDESIMAYADGEADPATCAAVEKAIKEDPSIAVKVARHRALRARVRSAFKPVLDEAVPARLTGLVGQGAKVVQLDSARQQRQQQSAPRRRWSWPEWGALAATLAVGVLFGQMALEPAGMVDAQGGSLVARGALATALDRQLASQPAGEVALGVSFADKQGAYCRTFRLQGSAGLACRQGKDWQIPVMVASAAQNGQYRQANAPLPPAVLEAVDSRIAGRPLDATQEKTAVAAGWKAAPAKAAQVP
jgi:hypothetical protein